MNSFFSSSCIFLNERLLKEAANALSSAILVKCNEIVNAQDNFVLYYPRFTSDLIKATNEINLEKLLELNKIVDEVGIELLKASRLEIVKN